MASNSKVKKYNKRKSNVNNVNGESKRRYNAFTDSEFDDGDMFPNDEDNHDDQESYLEYLLNH